MRTALVGGVHGYYVLRVINEGRVEDVPLNGRMARRLIYQLTEFLLFDSRRRR